MKPKVNFVSLLETFVKWNPVLLLLLLVVFSKKKRGPPKGKQISLGLGLQNRGKHYMQLFATVRGS